MTVKRLPCSTVAGEEEEEERLIGSSFSAGGRASALLLISYLTAYTKTLDSKTATV